MNRGPQRSIDRVVSKDSFAAKLAIRLGTVAPDWLQELALLADQKGLRGAGKRLGYSATTISQVISGQYPGDLDKIEGAVRGALMGLKVTCPELGEIGRDRCLFEQRKILSTASPQSIRLYRMCRSGTCPHSNLGETDA